MNTNILKKLWLSEDESKIYLFLIKDQNKTISDISKSLNINRPKLYKIIPSMIETWLISKIMNWKRTNYIAENPRVLKNYLENIKSDFDTYIPEIEKIYENKFKKPIFKHLKWENQVNNIYLDIANSLNMWDIFYRYSSRKNIEETSVKNSDFEKYKKIREEKNLKDML
jgi:sugar-specific transcriptional regulator TrmB